MALLPYNNFKENKISEEIPKKTVTYPGIL